MGNNVVVGKRIFGVCLVGSLAAGHRCRCSTKLAREPWRFCRFVQDAEPNIEISAVPWYSHKCSWRMFLRLPHQQTSAFVCVRTCGLCNFFLRSLASVHFGTKYGNLELDQTNLYHTQISGHIVSSAGFSAATFVLHLSLCLRAKMATKIDAEHILSAGICSKMPENQRTTEIIFLPFSC